jgi:biotin carboxylase
MPIHAAARHHARPSLASSLHPAGGAACNIFANRIVSVNNGTGYLADGTGAGVLLNNAVATANSTGVSAVNSGLTFTCKNNAFNGNLSSDGTPTNQIPPEMNGGGARRANSARRSLFDHARTPSGPYLLPLEQHVA